MYHFQQADFGRFCGVLAGFGKFLAVFGGFWQVLTVSGQGFGVFLAGFSCFLGFPVNILFLCGPG